MDTNTFVLFNKDGVVQRSIQEHQNVRCIDVYENSLYLALEEQIIRIDDFNTWAETKFTFTPKIKIYNMAVVNNNIIVCTEFHEGRVYEYNSEDNTTKMVLQGLRRPSYISVDHTPQGTRYILTLEGQSVKIYDESWQLQTTIKLRYGDPHDTYPCQEGFLVAEKDSGVINLYSYKGDLVWTLSTADYHQSLFEPICLTIKPPYIWVAEYGYYIKYTRCHLEGMIKCYKVLK